MNLQEVINLSENFLKLIFVEDFKSIEDVKEYINKNYIIGYEIFINQIIFEIFYESYMNDTKEVKTLMDVYKRKIKKGDNVKSYEYLLKKKQVTVQIEQIL